MLRLALVVLTLALSTAAGPFRDKADEKIDVPAQVTIEPGTSRAWAMAVCAVRFQVGNFDHALLSGAPSNAQNVKTLRNLLEIEYEVKRRVDLVSVLDKLMENGRQASFTQAMKSIRDLKLTDADVDEMFKEPARTQMRVLVKHAPRMSKEKQGVLAYDCVRYIQLCRFGYGAGYLTEEETWRRIDSMARKLQKAYTSFEHVGEIYAIGVDVFENEMSGRTWDAFKLLQSDEKGIWKSLPWNLKLNPLDKPEPKKPAEPAPPKK